MDAIEVRSLNFLEIARAQDRARGSNGLDFDWIKAAYERLTEGKGLLPFEEASRLAYRVSRMIIEADGDEAWLLPSRLQRQNAQAAKVRRGPKTA